MTRPPRSASVTRLPWLEIGFTSRCGGVGGDWFDGGAPALVDGCVVGRDGDGAVGAGECAAGSGLGGDSFVWDEVVPDDDQAVFFQ